MIEKGKRGGSARNDRDREIETNTRQDKSLSVAVIASQDGLCGIGFSPVELKIELAVRIYDLMLRHRHVVFTLP